MQNKINLQHWITLLLILLLAGCAGTHKNFPPSHVSMSSTAEQYLQQASQNTGDVKQKYQILAINQLLLENNLRDSQQLLNQLNDGASLNKNVDSQKKIAQAKFYLLCDRPKVALKKLHQVKSPADLSQEVAISYYVTAAEAHLRNNDLAYNTLALMSLSSLYTDQVLQQKNNNLIWRNLQTLTLSKLQKVLHRCNTELLRGWIQLAIIAHQDANNPVALSENITKWQQQYPQHPAGRVLPSQEKITNLAQIHPPQQIALLLPLHGRFAKMGQAVRDGFMTAYYANLKMLQLPLQIKVYDISMANVVDLYQQAVQDGAQFVIGPLTKQNVTKLASYNKLTIPVVALNYLPNDYFANNLVQFGLSPEQSVQQAADEMQQRHGLKFIECNYVCRLGEIDLIMQDKDCVVFVEVRARADQDFLIALESVDRCKQRKIVRAAIHYLQQTKQLNKVFCRFDVVAANVQNKQLQFYWLENAFS